MSAEVRVGQIGCGVVCSELGQVARSWLCPAAAVARLCCFGGAGSALPNGVPRHTLHQDVRVFAHGMWAVGVLT